MFVAHTQLVATWGGVYGSSFGSPGGCFFASPTAPRSTVLDDGAFLPVLIGMASRYGRR